MGLLSTLLERRSGRFTPDQELPEGHWAYRWVGGSLSDAGVVVNETVALNTLLVVSCVRIISETLASLSIPVYQRLQPRGRERARRHSLYRVLNRQANPRMTPFTFFERMGGHLSLWGNHYSVIERRKGDVAALWPVHPRYVEPYLTEGGELRYRIQTTRPRDLPAKDVLHVPGLAMDGLKGLTPLSMMRQAIGITVAAESYGAKFFGNDARPDLILRHPAQLSAEAQKQLRDSFIERHGGGRRGVAVLEEGMDISTVGIPPGDAQFLGTRAFQVQELARFFRIPPHMLADVERSTCLPGDALVYTEHGPRPIRDVRPGDRVWSLPDTLDGPMRLSSVTRMEQTGVDPIYTVRTTARALRANGRHRVLVRRKFPDPQPGLGGYRKVRWDNVWVPVSELRVGDYLVVAHGAGGGTGRIAPNGRQLTPAFMELCGLLIGDGSVGTSAVQFAAGDDAPYMEHYLEAMRAELVKCRLGGRGDASRRQHVPATPFRTGRSWVVRSVVAAREFADLGFAGNSHTKRVPGWVFTLDDDLKLAFLRGYLDADGAVNTRGWITYSSVSRDLLEDIRHLCISLRIPVGNVVTYEQPHSEYNGHVIRAAGWMHQLYLCDQVANQRIGSRHPRDAERLETAPPPERVGRWHPEWQGRGPSPEARPGTYFDLDGAALNRITAIDVSELAEPVYDLGVAETHSFIADGVVVHNSWGSGIEHQSLGFVVYTMRPWLIRIEQEINRKLFPESEWDKYYAEFLVDSLLRGDVAARTQFYQSARQWGYMSANDIRELENMNPIEGGDVYLQPMNMIDASRQDEMFGRERAALPDELRVVRSVREARSVAARRRLANAHRTAYRDVAARLIRLERNEVRGAVRRWLRERNAEAFREWLVTFYRDKFPVKAADYMNAPVRTLMEAIAAEVVTEVGGDEIPAEELDRYARDYAEVYARRHAGDSRSRLLKLLNDHEGRAARQDDELADLIDEELDEWDERVDRIAEDEAHRSANAVARFAYIYLGLLTLRWVATASDPCDYCQGMDGRVVSSDSAFLNAGTSFAPGGIAPFTSQTTISHPPLHTGCQCVIAPG